MFKKKPTSFLKEYKRCLVSIKILVNIPSLFCRVHRGVKMKWRYEVEEGTGYCWGRCNRPTMEDSRHSRQWRPEGVHRLPRRNLVFREAPKTVRDTNEVGVSHGVPLLIGQKVTGPSPFNCTPRGQRGLAHVKTMDIPWTRMIPTSSRPSQQIFKFRKIL